MPGSRRSTLARCKEPGTPKPVDGAFDPTASDREELFGSIIQFCQSRKLSGSFAIHPGPRPGNRFSKGWKVKSLGVVKTGSDLGASFDLSTADPQSIERMKSECEHNLGQGYVLTLIDVAQRIAPDAIAGLIYNLGQIIDTEALISVENQPSARANTWHPSLYPVDTWKYMLSLVGLESTQLNVQEPASGQDISRTNYADAIAISAWQKRNPFAEDQSRHYLYVRRIKRELPSRADICSRIRSILDVEYKNIKRNYGLSRTLPRLFYLVSFIQDWSFLKFFLDIWPASKICVILRTDFIVPAYSDLIEAHLTRNGVFCCRAGTVSEAKHILDRWTGGSGDLFLTATEGLPYLMHMMASRVTIAARKRGMTTATIQHGYLHPHKTSHAAQFFLATTEDSRADFERPRSSPECTPLAIGSPKNLDSTCIRPDRHALSFRLRSSAQHYRMRVLVGLNMHWSAHKEQGSGIDWLVHAATTNPDVLFVLRPHPDDWTSIKSLAFSFLPNIFLLDEITLLCIDWPVSRILASVDGTISTHSTLVHDSLSAGKPTALLPSGISDARLLESEQAWKRLGLVELSLGDLESGRLPANWPLPSTDGEVVADDALGQFIDGILELTGIADEQWAIASAEREVERNFADCCEQLSLDSHPHSNRQGVMEALNSLLNRG